MTPSWRFTTIDPIAEFLPAAARVLRGYNTLCIEHAHTDKDALELYSRHVSEDVYWPLRDTISPHTSLYYCHLTPEFVNGLLRLAGSRDTSSFLWHIRGYDGQRLIFYSHDACDGGEVLVSSRFPEGLITQLACEAGCNARPDEAKIDWESIQVKQQQRTRRPS